MQRHRRNRKVINIWILSVIVVVSLLLIMLNSGVKVLENAAGVIVVPFQKLGAGIADGIGSGVNSIFNADEIDEENADLRAQVDALKAELQLKDEVIKENERLTELLGYKEAYPEYTFIPAKVLSYSAENWSAVMVIDKGSNHGIEKDMPIVAQGGLVGRVYEVANTYSKVLTIVDTRSNLAAIVERSRDTGMVKGAVSADSGWVCEMHHMQFEPSIMPGDLIITSESGGVFPKGLEIGRVSEVAKDRNEKDDYATIEPSVDFAHLENVLAMVGSK